jgi:hypothetical protein
MSKKPIVCDVETTLEVFQKLRVIIAQELDGEPQVLYRYDLHGNTVPPEVIEYLSDRPIICHNGWFDIPLLQLAGVKVGSVWDTMTAEFFLSGGGLSRWPSLKDLVEKYHGITMDKSEQTSDWSGQLTQSQLDYAMNDVRYLPLIYHDQVEFAKKSNSIAGIYLKMLLIKEWSLDVWQGYPIDRQLMQEINYSCSKDYLDIARKFIRELPVSLLIKSNLSGKALTEIINKAKAYNVEAEPLKPTAGKLKVALREQLLTYDYDVLRPYFIENPMDDALLNFASPPFGKALFQHFGVKSTSYDKDFIKDFLESEEETHPAYKYASLILEMRDLNKISSTYAREDKDTMADHLGEFRLKSKVTATVTGRLTLTPLAQVPAPDDNKKDYQNKLSQMFIPPRGYKVLALDYGSEEDVAGGVFYRDINKCRVITEGFDTYLLFASKLFGSFEYTSPSQTAELKKKYKALRQSVKAATLAGNYAASDKKMCEMLLEAAEKNGMRVAITPDDIQHARASLYPQIYEAQQKLGEFIGETVVASLNPKGDWEKRQCEMSGFDKGDDEGRNANARRANAVRKGLLEKSNLVVSVGSPLGIQRLFPAYKFFNKVSTNNPKVKVTEIFNHPIQSVCGDILALLLVLLKKKYPEFVIPCAIHDSVVLWIPSDFANDETKSSIINMMRYAFWAILGHDIKVDGGYIDRGLKC